MPTFRNYEQGSLTWFKWRQDGVGGSDVPAIVGISGYPDHTRERVMEEKLTGQLQEDNFAMRRGRRLEPVAREAYCEYRGIESEPVCVEDEDLIWPKASLDGWCPNACEHGLVLEIKCPKWQIHDWVLEGIVPDDYQAQVQWQLMVAQVRFADFVSFNSGKRFEGADQLAVVRLEADIEYQKQLFDQCEQFWQEVVHERERQGVAVS